MPHSCEYSFSNFGLQDEEGPSRPNPPSPLRLLACVVVLRSLEESEESEESVQFPPYQILMYVQNGNGLHGDSLCNRSWKFIQRLQIAMASQGIFMFSHMQCPLQYLQLLKPHLGKKTLFTGMSIFRFRIELSLEHSLRNHP